MLSHTGFGYSSDLLQSVPGPSRGHQREGDPREGDGVVLQSAWLTQLPLGQCCVLVLCDVVWPCFAAQTAGFLHF